MTSDAINRGYIEAQVRGLSLDEVERIVVRREYGADGHFPDAASFDKALARVKELAAQYGIPCEESKPRRNV